jgi:hypothetical protein
LRANRSMPAIARINPLSWAPPCETPCVESPWHHTCHTGGLGASAAPHPKRPPTAPGMRSAIAAVLLALAQVALVGADVYLHSPRGSNNRLNEQNVNRDNNNRLFDSQNNNKGGYTVGVDDDDYAVRPLFYLIARPSTTPTTLRKLLTNTWPPAERERRSPRQR